MIDEYGERVTYLGTGIGTLDGAKRYLRRRWSQGLPEPVVRRPGARFYVTARVGRKTIPLLGPYVSHMTALAAVTRARGLAQGQDRLAFATIGTASVMQTVPTLFGR